MILSRHTQQSDSIEELHEQLDQAYVHDADWLEIWAIFSDDPWFQKRLRMCARKAVQRLHAPLEWTSDVEQEALIRIGVQLRKDKTLGFDASKGSLAGWLYSLTFRACLKSLRQFRDSKRMNSMPSQDQRSEQPLLKVQQRMELDDELDRLPDRNREILYAYLHGASVEDLASEEGVSLRTIYRLLQETQALLHRRLDDG